MPMTMASSARMVRLPRQSTVRSLRLCTRSRSVLRSLQPYIQATTTEGLHTQHSITREFSSRSIRWQGKDTQQQASKPDEPSQPGSNTQLAEVLKQSNQEDLVSEVHITPDPDGILGPDHPAMSILGNSSLVIQRQLELMNVIASFEQANRYIILDGQGTTVGYIAEEDHGIGRTLARQAVRTHRSFTAHILDANQREVLRIHRPFAYINSRIRIYDPVSDQTFDDKPLASASSARTTAQISPLKLNELRIIGECHQVWSAMARKYNLYSLRPDQASRIPSVSSSDLAQATESKFDDRAIEASMVQFAAIDEPMLSWDFNIRNKDQLAIGSVNRNFRGLGREIFTDTGVYALRMDSAAQKSVLEANDGSEVARYDVPGMTIDQRAIMLATAVSIDFDYFSRHSGASSSYLPFMLATGGGGAEAGAAGAAGGAVGGAAIETGAAAGALEGIGAAGAGAASRGAAGAAGAGAIESGIAGAGTMAGYEAMQRGFGRGEENRQRDDQSPYASDNPFPSGGSTGTGEPGNPQGVAGGEDVWGTGQDPWAEQSDADSWTGQASDAANGATEESGGIVQSILDSIGDWWSS